MPPQSYNFFGQSPAQLQPSQNPALLAQQMQLQEYNNPTSANTQPSQSMGSIDPKALASMMMKSQYAPGYTDSSGVSGNTLQAYGIAPGTSGGGLFQMNDAGNPLNLSTGKSWTPQDLQALQGAFSNG